MMIAWTLGETIAGVALFIGILVHIVTSLRFLYRMDARVSAATSAVERLESQVSGLRSELREEIGKLTPRTETVLVLQEMIRGLEMRLSRIEQDVNG